MQNTLPARPNQLLIRSHGPLRALHLDDGRRLTGEPLPGSAWSLVNLPPDCDLQDASASLRRREEIEAVVPNHVYALDSLPDDYQESQWSLSRIAAPQAWQTSSGRGGPLVAVLDTGIDENHPDLAPNLWTNPAEIANGRDDDGNGVIDDVHGFDAVHNGGDIHDGGEHGSHVAGIIAARGNNSKGVCGTAWEGRLLPIKIFDDSGNTDVATLMRALAYAAQQGAAIVNCSWGGAPYNQALFEAMRDCPALLVCSAGNSCSDNDTAPHYPSSFELPHLIAVAASNRDDGISFTSCYGAHSVDLAAPGIQIPSTVPGGGIKAKSGTSQAAPHVSGTAALMLAHRPSATPLQLKQALIQSADVQPQLLGKVVSGGRLNAARAIAQIGKEVPLS